MTFNVVVILAALAPSVPLVTLSLVGIFLARSRLKSSHPRASAFGAAGFGLLLLHTLLSAGIRVHAMTFAVQVEDKVAYARVLTIGNLMSVLLLIAALIFILLSVFADRGISESYGAAQQTHGARRDT
jgi:hypothetical protein